jgi:hypothetical protein
MKAKFGDKDSIQNGERCIIGYYKYNGPEPMVNTRRDFESAAYSETTAVPLGIYPILPGWDHYGRDGGEPTLYIEFKGTVTDDYFPASFAGVPVNQPAPKHKGEPRTVTRRIDPATAIEETGRIPNKEKNKEGNIAPDIYIDPQYWGDILNHYKKRLQKDVDYFINVNESGKNIDDLTSTYRYAASCISESASKVEKIQQSIEYQKNPTFKNYTATNTHWVPKAVPKKEIVSLKPKGAEDTSPSL